MALPVAVFKRFGEHAGGRLAAAISCLGLLQHLPAAARFRDRAQHRARRRSGRFARISSTGPSARSPCSAPISPTRNRRSAAALDDDRRRTARRAMGRARRGKHVAEGRRRDLGHAHVRAPERGRPAVALRRRAGDPCRRPVGLHVGGQRMPTSRTWVPSPWQPVSSSRSSSKRRCSWPRSSCSVGRRPAPRTAARGARRGRRNRRPADDRNVHRQSLHRRCERHLRYLRRRHRPAQLVLPRFAVSCSSVPS